MTTRIDEEMSAQSGMHLVKRAGIAERIARKKDDCVVFTHSGTDVCVRPGSKPMDIYEKWRHRRQWARATSDENHKILLADNKEEQ